MNNRALQFTSRSMFYVAETGQYRYWLKNGVLKLQVARAVLNKFTSSEIGKRLSRYVDMFEVGGGWFEVHAGDTSDFALFGTHTNGLRMWVKAFNEFFLSGVNANRPRVLAVYTAGRHTSPSTIAWKIEPSTPHSAPQPVSAAKLNALLNRFAH